ncbi:MAG TPA: MerR family transcriptional regulator [Ktedonobacterales bacterium]|nr:MerR family transcriptional regulator [Ktedonobacterales bacterium]
MGTSSAEADHGPAFYRIEQVAERTGLTRRTLRYYEEIGLLPPPRRTEGNYRLYSEEDLAYIERIHQMKSALGLSLKEVEEFLAEDDERRALHTTYHTQSDQAQRLTALERAESLTRRQLDLITRKIAALDQYSAKLSERLQRYEALRAERSEE